MQVDGSCHCGQVRFEAEGDPDRVSICHCTDCQSLTASAFRVSIPVREEDFRLLAGEPRIYVKTAASGNKRLQAFCSGCGSPIYSASPPGGGPRVFAVRVGTLRQRAALPPRRQHWHASALPWTANLFPELETIARD